MIRRCAAHVNDDVMWVPVVAWGRRLSTFPSGRMCHFHRIIWDFVRGLANDLRTARRCSAVRDRALTTIVALLFGVVGSNTMLVALALNVS